MNSNKVNEFKRMLPNDELIAYLDSVGISKPTQVQKDSISKLLGAGNFTVQAKTGSGKTLAFMLPLIAKLKEMEKQNPDKKSAKASPKALIIAPTRELSLQLFSIAKEISHFAKLRIRKLVGGDKGKSLASLYNSEIDILIASPDRAMRAFEKGELSRKELRYLVFDEADQLLEKSFEKTMAPLVMNVRNDKMQVFLVSASRPKNFAVIIKDFFPQRDIEVIGRGEENVLPHKVETFNSYLEEEDKFHYVKEFLKKQESNNGLVFTGNKARAKKVHELIEKTGCEKLFLLHKDLDRTERLTIVEEFRKGGGILVATDIFARGIDIPHLKWVLNFDLPSEPDYYLHRSGRVGRAGRSGRVFNFVTSKDSFRQRNINDALMVQGRDDLRIENKRRGGSGKNATKGKTKSSRSDKSSRSRNRTRTRK